MSQYIYAPGCAVSAYSSLVEEHFHAAMENLYGSMPVMRTCCFNHPDIAPGTIILTPCTTCLQRYRKLYPECDTRFVLEEILQSATFLFPNYLGQEMSIQDTCSARQQPETLQVVRDLLSKMNICVQEARAHGVRSKCCGEKLYGKIAYDKVLEMMRRRAEEMPCQDVVTYCASCSTPINYGGRNAHFIGDLLFRLSSDMKCPNVKEWNARLLSVRNASLQSSKNEL